MGTRFYQILTNREILYVVFNTTIDQFVTPASPSLEATAVLAEVSSEEFAEGVATNVFDLRRDTIHEACRLLAKLKCGQSLNLSEAYIVKNFADFLQAAVAPHQHDYEEIDQVIARSRKELRLNRRFAEYDDWELVNDCAMYPSFEKKVLDSKTPLKHSIHMPSVRTSKGQRKLAGRYVSVLATIANIAGPGKLTPREIVEKFRWRRGLVVEERRDLVLLG